LRERFRRRRAPQCLRRYVSRDHRSGSDDRSPADPNVAEDHTMRPDVNLILDLDGRGMLGGALRPPVEVREDGRSHSDRTVVADRNGVGINVVNVDLLPEPHPRTDSDAPKSMKSRPQAAA